jgi:hypothetical protein
VVADRVSLSFGTYRRHLATGRDRSARWLWESSRVAQIQSELVSAGWPEAKGQNEITGRIARALQFEPAIADAGRLTDNPDALDYILRGRALAWWKPISRENNAEGLSLFKRYRHQRYLSRHDSPSLRGLPFRPRDWLVRAARAVIGPDRPARRRQRSLLPRPSSGQARCLRFRRGSLTTKRISPQSLRGTAIGC